MRAPELNIVQAFVRSAASNRQTPSIHLYPTVALSRDYGAGGEDVARLLARALGVRCLDGELIDAIAAETRGDRDAVKRMDERVRTLVDDWLYNFFTQQKVEDMTYLVHLIHVMLDVPEHGGGVIVGRGGALVLPRAQAFRVKISGSLGVCADRVMRDENIGHFQAEEKINRVNKQRADFIRSRFSHDPADMSIYDMVIMTDRFDAEHAMRLILHGMFLAGFELPASALVKIPVRRIPELSAAGR
jgi:cytidylate kinase